MIGLLEEEERFAKYATDNDLPWVSSGKHLGNNLENTLDGMKHDIRVKRAQYITKNNDLA